MGLDGAPIAAEKAVSTDHVEGTCDIAAGALRHDQQASLAEAFAKQREEAAIKVRIAPFAAAGVGVEFEERVPMSLGDVAAGDVLDGDAGGERRGAFLADRLALARCEARQKVV